MRAPAFSYSNWRAVPFDIFSDREGRDFIKQFLENTLNIPKVNRADSGLRDCGRIICLTKVLPSVLKTLSREIKHDRKIMTKKEWTIFWNEFEGECIDYNGRVPISHLAFWRDEVQQIHTRKSLKQRYKKFLLGLFEVKGKHLFYYLFSKFSFFSKRSEKPTRIGGA